jgi:hypothetical protein
MVVEPNRNQHPDIQKLNLNVTKLEKVTMEALHFFPDEDDPSGARAELGKVFKVAKVEERYRNGEIGKWPCSVPQPAREIERGRRIWEANAFCLR